MALEYQLRIATERAALEVLALLARESGLVLAGDCAAGVGVVARAVAESALGRSIILQALGFEPSVLIAFRVVDLSAGEDAGEPGADREPAGVRTVVRASLALLNVLPGDAALLFNGETTLFLRLRERSIALDDAGDFWSDTLLALVPGPRERRDLPLL